MSKHKPFLLHVTYQNWDDLLYIITKDPVTKKKYKYEIPRPTVPAWVLNDETKLMPYYKEYEVADNLSKHEVPVKDRETHLARILKSEAFLQDVKEGKCDKSEIYLDRRLYSADMNPEDWSIMQYLDTTVDDDVPMEGNVSFGCLDIEIDSIDFKDVKVSEIHKRAAKVPVNAITYLDSAEKTVYTYALINKDYKGQLEVMNDTTSFVKRVVENTAATIMKDGKDDTIKGILLKALGQLKFKIMFFDKDLDLIGNCLNQIYKKSMPDFLQVYNAQFDIRFLEERMKALGLSKYEMFTHPDFKNKFVRHNYKDESIHPKERKHSYSSSSYTKIVDQQIFFFGLRPQQKLDTNSLDSVVKFITGIGKLSYAHICNHILDLVRADFATFLEYNMRDVLAQYFVELIANDIEAMMTMCYKTRCVPERAIQAMASVNGSFMHDAMRKGKYYGNEINKALSKKFQNIQNRSYAHEYKNYMSIHGKKPSEDGEKELKKLAGRNIVNFMRPEDKENLLVKMYVNLNAPKIKGGYCSDPTRLGAKGVEVLPGVHSKTFHECLVDIDAKSQYPTTIIYHNISRSALFDKIVAIEDSTHEPGRFCELIINDDIHLFGEEMLGLPSIDELAKEFGLGEVQEVDAYNQEIKTIKINTDNYMVMHELNDTLKSIDKSLKAESPNAGKYMISPQMSTIFYKDGVVNYKLRENELTDVFNTDSDILVDGREVAQLIKNNKPILKSGTDCFDVVCMCTPPDDTEFYKGLDDGFIGSLSDKKLLYGMLDSDIGSINFTVGTIPITLSKRHISLIDRFKKCDSDIHVSVYKTEIEDMYTVKIASSLPVKKLKDSLDIEYAFNIVA
jgi:hypothetical protein